jgi:hypothetical protein
MRRGSATSFLSFVSFDSFSPEDNRCNITTIC